MAYEQKDMSGAVFQNKDKQEDTHADRNGDCKIDGVEYWISGWLKKTKSGDPYLYLSFKRKMPVQRQNEYAAAKGRPQRDIDEPQF